MRVSTGFLTILLASGCPSDGSDSPPSMESADCAKDVARARQRGGDSVFADARGLAQSCPDAMALALVALWAEPLVTPQRASQLRAVSAVIRDERLVAALEAVVRDPAQPVETRVEGLSALSYYLQAGRWVEFTFLKDQPDSASLRMFMGVMDTLVRGDESHPISAAYPVRFREMLESLRQTDSSQVIRSAARRFLLFLDYSRQQLEQQRQEKQPPATPAPPDA